MFKASKFHLTRRTVFKQKESTWLQNAVFRALVSPKEDFSGDFYQHMGSHFGPITSYLCDLKQICLGKLIFSSVKRR